MEQNNHEKLFLGKWLSVLFWLIVPGTLAGILVSDNFRNNFPGLYLPGQILNLAVSVCYGGILLLVGTCHKKFRISGICFLTSFFIMCAGTALLHVYPSAGWIGFLSLPSAAISVAGDYYEFSGYCAVLTDANDLLSRKWAKLWKWSLAFKVCSVISPFLMFIIRGLALQLLLLGGIGGVVVSVIKLVYLYKTAWFFKSSI